MQDFKIQALTDPQRNVFDHIADVLCKYSEERKKESKKYDYAYDTSNEKQKLTGEERKETDVDYKRKTRSWIELYFTQR